MNNITLNYLSSLLITIRYEVVLKTCSNQELLHVLLISSNVLPFVSGIIFQTK